VDTVLITTRPQLKRVSVLTGSRLINLTVAIAQPVFNTGKLIQIYPDRELFDAATARALRPNEWRIEQSPAQTAVSREHINSRPVGLRQS
jgi:predicted HAD superfamily Cof-like phosphohydrolase